ncbi:SUMF1/EgtB/PvdO family nonheme iron enzyme [Sulfurimonas sp. MAG313]|nr:SUMF1/EgtB/PvdO family nonheme iron enzyme [Sulfurimonas sp. MAG313]MDF1882183.1 SUMF1/EgtB/PvdO family nonheme iron enzyme [Sulfurimonas sp. MAG313]
MRYIFFFLLFVSLLQASKISLQTLNTEPRTAYIIGNSDYEDSPIDKARSNAQLMKNFLQEHNFDIIYKEDASKRDIIRGLREFSSTMRPHGISLFYFCGHMVQMKGENYLIPLEAGISNDYHVLYKAIAFKAILNKMQSSSSRLNILIIDSGYKDPFGKSFRTKEKGLAKLKKHDNFDVVFSLHPNTALKPYPFTQKLIPVLSLKGISNKEALKTFVSRYPQSYTLTSKQDFFFKVPNKLEDKDKKAWTKALRLNSISSYSLYLLAFPQGKHIKQAGLDLVALSKKADDTLKLQKELEQRAQEDIYAEEALEVLKTEQVLLVLKQNKKEAEIKAEAKKKEDASIQAALLEEQRITRENTPFIEPLMIKIKAGSFKMHSDDISNAPRHLVQIKNDFYIGRFEVTNAEYKEFLHDTQRKNLIPPNWTSDSQPAIGLSWDDAVAYTLWLSKLSGKSYRLPTEEEWEYSARAGTQTKYYWGDEDTSAEGTSFWKTQYPNNAHNYAWIKTNAKDITHIVGSKIPNAWGLFDITGNVEEWCLSANKNDSNSSLAKSYLKTYRGGSWFSTPQESTLSYKSKGNASLSSYTTGFRLVREK